MLGFTIDCSRLFGVRGKGPMVVRFILVVLATFAVLYGCDRASPPAERQERDAGSDGGTAVGEAFARAELRPVGGSGVSGEAVFKEVGSLGVHVELEVSGLPAPGNPEEQETYFAQAHGGSCSEAPRGGGQGPGDGHPGHDHEHGGGGPSLALARLDRFFGASAEYADHPEYASPPADGLPGNVDYPLSLAASADGTAAVSSLLEGVEPDEITSGGPRYLDLRAPNNEPPEDWPALACADLG
jgi:hypothetical protein